MHYMLLINHDPSAWAEVSEEFMGGVIAEHEKLQTDTKAEGVFVAAERLASVETATTVRKQDEEWVITDGPFAESKEVMVGYYLLNCDNLDQALDYARRIPVPDGGGVEVRPVYYSVPAE